MAKIDLRGLERHVQRAEQHAWLPAATWLPSGQWSIEYPGDPNNPSDPLRLALRQEKCKNYVFGPLRTTDAQERVTSPVKQVPRLPYLGHWLDALIREPDLIGPKVRRMIQTLTAEGYCKWRVEERPGTYVALVHATETVGARHIEDELKNVMHANMPDEYREMFLIAENKGRYVITHRMDQDGRMRPWDSWIAPYPVGDRKLESFGHAVILWDEFASYPGAKEASKGIVPTLVGRTMDRGQLIRMGTVNPNTASGRYYKEIYEPHNFRRARQVARYGLEIPSESEVIA